MGSILKGQTEKMIKQECHQYMEQFINKNKEEIMIQLIMNCKTWDNYSVSILYLHLVENIIQGYKIQIRFMSKFQDILNQKCEDDVEQEENKKKKRKSKKRSMKGGKKRKSRKNKSRKRKSKK